MAKNFKIPSPKKLKDLGRDLKLSDAQARELDFVIRHAHADLEGIFRMKMTRAERARRLKQLKIFRGALMRLASTMGTTPEEIADFNVNLPFELRETIGQMASAGVIRTVVGRRVEEVEADHIRKSAELTHGAEIFHHQLLEISKGIDTLLDAAVKDPGGRNPDLVRNHLATKLARSSRGILGRRASGTAGGRFSKLVAAVFIACGLADDGVEKIVERTLKSLQGK
ncbi:MAG: hypothetical protein WCN98_16545 [Verrucomicrobiaceae bacterium]|uniref:hypothetical protein n=1 Tax=Aestuariivirga sp. TaxID=2650926 RepID=UPI00301A3A69